MALLAQAILLGEVDQVLLAIEAGIDAAIDVGAVGLHFPLAAIGLELGIEDHAQFAAELRIPVAPVLNGETIFDCEHFVDRNVFVDDPTGTFKMPRPAWRLDDADPPPPDASPHLGEHDGRVEVRPPARPPAPTGDRRLPQGQPAVVGRDALVYENLEPDRRQPAARQAQ